MARILIGTSGYSYTDWVGPLYPEGTRSEDFLGAYALSFPTVELNFSYYRMPSSGQLAGLMERGGPALSFSVKANESLTCKIDPSSWRGVAVAFLAALEPLRAAGRLEAVLFQFPASFGYEVDHRRYLNDLLVAFAGVPRAVEFRNHEWYNNRVLEAFRERGVALVSLDLPALRGLPPVMDVVTAPLAYVRLHGRNEAAWWGSDEASRYDYTYSDLELEAWGDRVSALAAEAGTVLVYFNNHPRGQAVRNARSFSRILSQAGVPV